MSINNYEYVEVVENFNKYYIESKLLYNVLNRSDFAGILYDDGTNVLKWKNEINSNFGTPIVVRFNKNNNK